MPYENDYYKNEKELVDTSEEEMADSIKVYVGAHVEGDPAISVPFMWSLDRVGVAEKVTYLKKKKKHSHPKVIISETWSRNEEN